MNTIIGSFEEHYGSKKGHHYKKGHKKGYVHNKFPIRTHKENVILLLLL